MGRSILVLLLCINAIPVASAHLMVAQQGTLNVVDGGAVDDDGDGKLSREEFARHQTDLRAAVMQGMQLRDSDGVRPLQGLMLTPVFSDEAPQQPGRLQPGH